MNQNEDGRWIGSLPDVLLSDIGERRVNFSDAILRQRRSPF